jgi:hypothetical protein
VAIVATSNGIIHRLSWSSAAAGIESYNVAPQFAANTINGVAGFYSDNDQLEHIIVGTKQGSVYELWLASAQADA